MKARLNDTQTAVLRWLADGQPDGAATNPQRLTARALSSRRLVKIKGRGPKWHAELTEAGRHHLEYGEYPFGHFGPEPGPEPERAPIAEPVTTAKPAGRVKANKQQGAEPVRVDEQTGKGVYAQYTLLLVKRLKHEGINAEYLDASADRYFVTQKSALLVLAGTIGVGIVSSAAWDGILKVVSLVRGKGNDNLTVNVTDASGTKPAETSVTGSPAQVIDALEQLKARGLLPADVTAPLLGGRTSSHDTADEPGPPTGSKRRSSLARLWRAFDPRWLGPRTPTGKPRRTRLWTRQGAGRARSLDANWSTRAVPTSGRAPWIWVTTALASALAGSPPGSARCVIVTSASASTTHPTST
ncbi:MAG: hypothetical protein ACRCYU_21840 [Nocardioides sp.]